MKKDFIIPVKKLNEVEEEFDKILHDHKNEIIRFTILELEHSKKHIMVIFEL